MAKVGKKFNFGDLAPEIPSQNTADDADAPPGSPAAAAKSLKSEPQEDADPAPPAGAKKRKAIAPKKQVKKEEKEDSSEGAPPPPPADDDSSDDVVKKKRAVAAEGGEGVTKSGSGGGKHRKGWTAFNEKSGHKTENGRRKKDWSKPKKPKAAKGAEGEEEGEKKRRNPGRAALSEIKRMQKTTDLIIPDLTMVRIIKEAIQDVLEDPRFHNTKVQDGAFLQRGAAVALHHATEDYTVELFYYANRLAIHRGRQTIMPQDIREVCYLLNNARSTRFQ